METNCQTYIRPVPISPSAELGPQRFEARSSKVNTLWLNGTLSCVDFMDVVLGDISSLSYLWRPETKEKCYQLKSNAWSARILYCLFDRVCVTAWESVRHEVSMVGYRITVTLT